MRHPHGLGTKMHETMRSLFGTFGQSNSPAGNGLRAMAAVSPRGWLRLKGPPKVLLDGSFLVQCLSARLPLFVLPAFHLFLYCSTVSGLHRHHIYIHFCRSRDTKEQKVMLIGHTLVLFFKLLLCTPLETLDHAGSSSSVMPSFASLDQLLFSHVVRRSSAAKQATGLNLCCN